MMLSTSMYAHFEATHRPLGDGQRDNLRMTVFSWPANTVDEIGAFERRRGDPEIGALLLRAVHCVDALQYLDDFDSHYDASREIVGAHRPDVVDVAHARWATSTCITGLDLCAAALARAFIGPPPGINERDLVDLDATPRQRKDGTVRPSEAAMALRTNMPSLVLRWIDGVVGQNEYATLKLARNSLIHRRLPRNLHASTNGSPNPRLSLLLDGSNIPVRDLVVLSRDFAASQISALNRLLPQLP